MKNKLVILVFLLFMASPCFAQQLGQKESKISLDVKGMDIVDVLKVLSQRSGLNLVIGKNVTGRVTLFLKDVDIWDAFEIMLLANELAFEKKGGIINVMTQRDYELLYGERYKDKKEAKAVPLKYAKAADLSKSLSQIKTTIGRIIVDEGSNTLFLMDIPEKLKEMEDFIKSTDLPVQTQVFSLNYAQADKISAKIQEVITKGVGSIRIDERTNKVIVTDFARKLEEISNIVSAFDEKTNQVLIDAQIIEIKPSDKFEMGIDWDYWLEKNFRLATSMPTSGALNKLSIGTAARGALVAGKGEYKGIIDLLRTIGDTKILSSPRIMAVNNQEAKILVGTKEPYATQTTVTGEGGTVTTAENVSFVDVGIKLYVTPAINRDGFVTMKIRPEVSSAAEKYTTAKGERIPIVSTSEAETSVMVKDGVTVIIGGLRKDERSKTVTKVPLLGDIPGVGFLFRNTSDEHKKTELVILLTPHILSGSVAYTDFSEIKPEDGAVIKMEKGNLVTEKTKKKDEIPRTCPGILRREPRLASDEPSARSEDDAVAAALRRGRATPPKAIRNNRIPSENCRIGSKHEEIGEMMSFEYYKAVIDRVKSFVSTGRPQGEKGNVNLLFTVSQNGALIGEPYIFETDNSALAPFAVKAIKDASPFPSFPQSLDKDKETFKINLGYE